MGDLKNQIKRVFIIAEIGKNFIQIEKNQPVSIYLKNAKDLVLKAKAAGADAVKFQTHHYQDEQADIDAISPHFKSRDRYTWVKHNSISTPIREFWEPLVDFCKKEKIIFFSTPMSYGAALILQKLKVPLWKIGSGDILDFVMLDYIAKTKKPIIISSGMSTERELDTAIDFLKRKKADITLLHCVSQYPCPPENLNLATIKYLKNRYQISIGFSDHSLKIDSALVAVALGAIVIEKHLSLSRKLWGSDHKASLTVSEFTKLVATIRSFEQGKIIVKQTLINKYLGVEDKIMRDTEAIFRPYFRKTLVASCNIKSGTIIKPRHVYAMRPQIFLNGLASEKYESILGQKAITSINKYMPIRFENFKNLIEKRRICVVVASRANYGRVKYLLRAIKDHPELELQLVVGASTMLYRYGKAVDIIKKDGFIPVRQLYYVVEGENLITQAKSTGLGLMELSTAFEELKPHAVVTVADRFETLATAVAAVYQNIPLIHLQGGEVSGNIDDKVRHAITQMADFHFPATQLSKKRIIKMGADAKTVYNLGCPAMDVFKLNDLTINNEIMQIYGGTGVRLDWSKPYLLMVQHPVTTSYGQGFKQVTETLDALNTFKQFNKIVLWPNIDAGTDDIAKAIRVFRENNSNENFHYFRNFSPEDYARVLNNCVCAVGNSSSFIREGAYLGVPAVIVGNRQKDREHGRNILFAPYSKTDIIKQVKQQIKHGRFKSSNLFGKGGSGIKIANQISALKLTSN